MKVIITGGPCTGKSSIIDALEKKGYHTHQEFARQVIAEQLQLKTDLVPWLNNIGFSAIVLQKMIALNETIPNSETHFLDRGIPDLAAYLKVTKDPLPKGFEKALTQAGYHSVVFLLPPWKEIYINDAERKEPYEKALQIYDSLKSTYQNLGFKVIEVPKTSVEERVDFILQMV